MDTVDICAAGDVVLICGEEKEGSNKTALRVSSAILSLASPVFNALLSPRFREGSDLASTGTVEIPLPDDDAADLTIACHILHLQNDKVPRYFEKKQASRIAELSHKYDLGRALRPQAEVWIQGLLSKAGDADREELLLCAYNFEHAEMFRFTSQQIVWSHTGVDVGCGLDELHKVLHSLEAQRVRHRQVLMRAIDQVVNEARTMRDRLNNCCSGRCAFAEKYLQHVLKHLTTRNLWPISSVNGKSLIFLTTSMKCSELEAAHQHSKGTLKLCEAGTECVGNKDSNGGSRKAKMLRTAAETVEFESKGVCYYCVREDKLLTASCDHPK